MDAGKTSDAMLDKISDLLRFQRDRADYCVTLLAVMRRNAPPSLVPMIDHLVRELGGARIGETVKGRLHGVRGRTQTAGRGEGSGVHGGGVAGHVEP